MNTGAMAHPDWSADKHAQTLKHDIDMAFDLGYRVAISSVWKLNVEELAGALGPLSAGKRAPALHAVLHDNYEATPVFSDPFTGEYYELRRKPAH
jgi:hypothetical protein